MEVFVISDRITENRKIRKGRTNMGLFDFFRKKKEATKEVEDYVKENDFEEQLRSNGLNLLQIEKQNIDFTSKEERTNYIKSCCEKTIEASKQIDEAKVEYSAVTSYLVDMQKIDRITGEEREDLETTARDIITLNREQENFRNDDITISPAARRTMQKYRNEIVTELKKMQDNEAYQRVIKNDMKHLEGEKAFLKYQRQEIVAKQKYLKGIAVTTSVLVVVLFLVIFSLAYGYKADMRPPFVVTILMASITAIYIFLEANKNRTNMVLTEKKLNKAIGLLNKVKIKYINNTNCLEYTYEKFGVNSSMELEHIWQQYEEMKKRERKIRENFDKLSANNEKLVALLEKYEVEDPEVWIYQAQALLDQKEMVEIRHRLNVRRQKLRDRIDYNNQVKLEALEEIQKILEKKPELKEEVIYMLQSYELNI